MLGSDMSDVINFRKARKRVERKLDERRATENRLRFGLSKADRNLIETRNARVSRDLDQHRVETGGEQ